VLLDELTPVDGVWSVTGGWPAAFGGFAGAVVLCAFGSVVELVVDCVEVVLDCAFGSAGVVLCALEFCWSGVVVDVAEVELVAWAKAIAAANVTTIRTTANFLMRNSCAKDPGSLPRGLLCVSLLSCLEESYLCGDGLKVNGRAALHGYTEVALSSLLLAAGDCFG
jgi:hypothetical protein